VNVTFTPGGATAVTGGFTVTSNATDSTDTIAFSGTGTQPAPTVYSVNLSWAPSSTPGITGYDLYRGTVMGGPYTLLTTVSPTSESYVDATAQTGQTYYYVVTSIGANGVQSSYSNVATAVVQ
jgi:fibronectin type 3 domain-containing protein